MLSKKRSTPPPKKLIIIIHGLTDTVKCGSIPACGWWETFRQFGGQNLLVCSLSPFVDVVKTHSRRFSSFSPLGRAMCPFITHLFYHVGGSFYCAPRMNFSFFTGSRALDGCTLALWDVPIWIPIWERVWSFTLVFHFFSSPIHLSEEVANPIQSAHPDMRFKCISILNHKRESIRFCHAVSYCLFPGIFYGKFQPIQ